MMDGMMMNGSMMGGYGMIFGMGLMVLVWVGIFYLAYRLVKLMFGKTKSRPQESAIDTLNRRYANGEISAEQFQDIKQNIKPSVKE